MNMTELDQTNKLSLDFKIINYIANETKITEPIQLSQAYSKLYSYFKIHKQKKNVNRTDFEEYLKTVK